MAVALNAVVHQAVESSAGELWELGQFLWGNPETSMKEATAHDKLSEFLERKGFQVTRRYLLDTAFRAEFCAPGGIDGPTIAFLAEYDALPEIGHACGHNLVSECALGAAVAVREVMKEFKNIRGKILVLGTPGQEKFGGKEVLRQKNAFKEIDAVLLAHPAVFNCANPPLSARQEITVQFQSSVPFVDSPWEASSALDAAVTSYVNLALLRQQIKPASRILGMLLASGGNNVTVPETSQLMYQLRAPTAGDLAVLMGRVEACFEAAAQATDCCLVQEKGIVYKEFVHNNAFVAAYSKHAREMGVLFGDADEALVVSAASSSDSGNVSQALPCLQAAFAIASAGANHSKTFAAAAGSREAQAPTRRAAKILALTALDLYTDPKLLGRVKQEFHDWKSNQQEDRKENKQPCGS
ncbi:xaa-Arg dipeptidase-like [Amblyomma americanum]